MKFFLKIGAGLAIIASWVFIASLAIGGPHQYCHVNENHIEFVSPCESGGFRHECVTGTTCTYMEYEDAKCSFALMHTCVGGIPTQQYAAIKSRECRDTNFWGCECNPESVEIEKGHVMLDLYTCL